MTTISYIFNYPWSLTTLASWKKYPHPKRPDILNVELISKIIESNELTLQRLITIKYSFPSWIPCSISNSLLYCLETTTLNLEHKTMSIDSYNLSFQNLIKLHETCLYTSLTDHQTKLIQTVIIQSHFGYFNEYIQNWFLNEYLNTVNLGRQIISDTLHDLSHP
jgi:hypothetical protein